jgi:hypothetical protein
MNETVTHHTQLFLDGVSLKMNRVIPCSTDKPISEMDTILKVEKDNIKNLHEGKNVDGGMQTDMRGVGTSFHYIRHGAASD